MSRLSPELERLYLGTASAGTAPEGVTRAIVLELKRPLDWFALGRVYHGVQADFGWPAPAIAVSGEGQQLWFSLRQPVARERALALLGAFEARWLADVARRQVDAKAHPMDGPPPRVPARLEGDDRWSAFVASDLVAMFEDTPWLDVEPNEEGQAALLRPLRPVTPEEFEGAERQVAEAMAPAETPAAAAPPPTTDPRHFLISVMNDPAAPLALRIEAAKALLS
jgi:hypothetical protein